MNMINVLSKSTKSKVELKAYVEVDGLKYFVDNKKVVLEPTKK